MDKQNKEVCAILSRVAGPLILYMSSLDAALRKKGINSIEAIALSIGEYELELFPARSIIVIHAQSDVLISGSIKHNMWRITSMGSTLCVQDATGIFHYHIGEIRKQIAEIYLKKLKEGTNGTI